MTNHTKIAKVLAWASLSVAALAMGCERTESTTEAGSEKAAVTSSSPGGAQSFGTPSGMGFSTGNAAQSGGMGTGLAGFHGTGAAGTSGTISDTSMPMKPEAQEGRKE